ncbi:MAG: alkaline phosphatase family protein [Microbacterium sp.]
MSIMLPTLPRGARRLTELAPECLAAVRGESTWLAPATSIVLVLIDGLGAIQLRAHAGHARRLAAAMSRRDQAATVLPSTTAAALTSLVTGAWPGEHGLVGYLVRDPETGRMINQLSGYEKQGPNPATWQRVPTVFERAAALGHPVFAVGRAEYATSGFSAAVLRGAQYVAEDEVRSRLEVSYALAQQHAGAVVYCYLPEVDKAGHRNGVDSDAWRFALEGIDAAFAMTPPPGVGVLVTADHGMIDAPAHRHVLLQAGDDRLDSVAQVGGEPRMLHLYLDEGADADAVAATWRRLCADAAEVATRAEAVDAGLFGPVDPAVEPRIGDVLIAARGLWAFYDDRVADKRSQKMIGQHGSVSPEELTVPLIRLGAFA